MYPLPEREPTAHLHVPASQLLGPGPVARGDRREEASVLVGDALKIIVLTQKPPHPAAQRPFELVEQSVASEGHDGLVEICGESASPDRLARPCGRGFVLEH